MNQQSVIHIVIGKDDTPCHVGKLQAEWLVERGHATYDQLYQEGHVYRSSTMTADEIDKLIMATPETRTCDFCQRVGAPWNMNVRPFMLRLGPHPGRFARPVAICDDCVPLVRANDRQALIEAGIKGAVDKALEAGGYLALVARSNPPSAIRRQIQPIIREAVRSMIGHRDGEPYRAG